MLLYRLHPVIRRRIATIYAFRPEVLGQNFVPSICWQILSQ